MISVTVESCPRPVRHLVYSIAIYRHLDLPIYNSVGVHLVYVIIL